MPVVPPLKTDSYFRHEEMCQHMRALADALPHLVKVQNIGTSRSGRALLLAEVTAQATGTAESKPALWLDGNNRGCEVGSSMACLAVLQGLATEYGRDERITNLLDRCVFYILPRVCLDGAEACLTAGWNGEEGIRAGIKPCDVDGNGKVLQMRRQHPLGEWKVSQLDARLMVPRTLDDSEGPFYQLVSEGVPVAGNNGCTDADGYADISGYEAGFTEASCAKVGCLGADRPEPGSPEDKARRAFLSAKQNICAVISLNGNADGIAFSEALEREPKDAQLFVKIGQLLASSAEVPLTKDRSLSWPEELYRERGLLAFRAGLWSFRRLAEMDSEHPFADEEQLRALQWLDSLGIENSCVPWQTFAHPDWGEVEIGGWDLMQMWHNPPLGELLDGFCQTHLELVLSLAELLPDLRWNSPVVELAGRKFDAEGPRGKAVAWNRVEAELSNWGYLPTWLTERYRARHQGISVSLQLPEGGKAVAPPPTISCGHLAGLVSAHLGEKGNSMLLGGAQEGRCCRVSWLIEGGSKVELTATCPAGGRAVVSAAVSAPSTNFAASSEEMAPASNEAPRSGYAAGEALQGGYAPSEPQPGNYAPGESAHGNYAPGGYARHEASPGGYAGESSSGGYASGEASHGGYVGESSSGSHAHGEAPHGGYAPGGARRSSRGENSANSSATQARNVSLLQGLGLDAASPAAGSATKPSGGGVIRGTAASGSGATEKSAQPATVDLTGGRSVVRPVNLLSKSGAEANEATAAPEPKVPATAERSAMGGYRPQARPMRAGNEAAGLGKSFPSGEYRAVSSPSGEYRAVAEREAASARLAGRSDSPLRKEAAPAPSGRVFGQSGPKRGGAQPAPGVPGARAPLGRPVGHAEAEQRRQQMERAQSQGEVTTYGGFEVKPHSLLGNKKPSAEPEPEPQASNPVPTGPVTAQLLRRNKEE